MSDLSRAELATAQLRRVDEPGWDELSGRIKDVLRSTVFPASTVRVDRAAEGAEEPETRDMVSTRALRALLRGALQAERYAPHAISFRTEGERLVGLEVHLTVVYGVRLPDLLQQILDHVSTVLEDALGRARAEVEVHIRATELIEQPPAAR